MASCGGNYVCLIDCDSGKVVLKYKLLDEDFYSVAWSNMKVAGETLGGCGCCTYDPWLGGRALWASERNEPMQARWPTSECPWFTSRLLTQWSVSLCENHRWNNFISLRVDRTFFISFGFSIDSDASTWMLATSGFRGSVRLLRPDRMTCVLEVKHHKAHVNSLLFHPSDSQRLFTGSADQSVCLWRFDSLLMPSHRTSFTLLMKFTVPISIFGGFRFVLLSFLPLT